MCALDKTVVATALPDIALAFKATTNYSWVATAYLLAAAVAMPVAGRLTDLVGGRRPLLTAFAIFTFGSLLCGLAPSMHLLILARTFQGIGGGAMLAVGTAVVGLTFEGRKRTQIFAMLAAFSGMSAALGPLIGGILTEYASWRWIFFINFPLGILAFGGLFKALQESESHSRDPMDWGGAALCAGWTVPLFFAFSWGGSSSRWDSPLILGLLGFSLLSLIGFWIREKGFPTPLLDLNLFSNRAFRYGSSAYFSLGATTTTILLFLPLYLIQIQELPAPHAGLILSSEVFGLMVGNGLAGRITQARGRYYGLLIVGNAIALLSLFGLRSTLVLEPGIWASVGFLVMTGLGLGLVMPVYLSAVQNAVSRERLGTASSALQFSRILGAALGAALMGTLMVSSLHESLPKTLEAKLRPLGVTVNVSQFEEPAHLRELFLEPAKKSRTKLEKALGGDSEMQAWVVDFLGLSEAEAEELKSGTKAAEEKFSYRLEEHLKALEDGLEQSSREALLHAVQQVYTGAIGFLVLTMLFTFFMPNVPLKEKAEEQTA